MFYFFLFFLEMQFGALWIVKRLGRGLSCLHAQPSILTTVVLDEEVYYYAQWRNAFPLNATLIFSLVAVRVTHFHSEWNTPSDLCSRRNLWKPCFWRPRYWQVFMCVWWWRRERQLCRQLDRQTKQHRVLSIQDCRCLLEAKGADIIQK